MLKKDSGFTLTELMIAMAVFSFMLVIVALGFITLVRAQQKGIAERNVQQNARRAMEAVVRNVREATTIAVSSCNGGSLLTLTVSGSGDSSYFLTGTNPNKKLVRANGSTCASPAETLTSNDVQVQLFTAELFTPAGGKQSVRMTMRVGSSGFDVTGGSCPATPALGGQFCAVTLLTTTATVRGTP